MDLKSLTLPELNKLSANLTRELAKRQKDVNRDLVKRMEKLAKEHGLSLVEVIGTAQAVSTPVAKPKRPQAQKSNGSKLPMKYWNPLNPNEGWSGHARRPKWVVNWLENGGMLEDLLQRRVSKHEQIIQG